MYDIGHHCVYTHKCIMLLSFPSPLPRTAINNTYAYSVAFGFSRSLIFFLYAIVFRFGAYLVTQPTDHIAYVPFFDVFRVFIAIVFGGAAIGQASAFAPDLTKAKLSANRIFFMLDRKPLIDNYSTEGEEKVTIFLYRCETGKKTACVCQRG